MSFSQFSQSVAISILASLSALTPAWAEDIVFLLENDTSSTEMIGFYASPATAEGWEDDILNGYVIGGQQRARITLPDDNRGCIYDFLAVFSNGSRINRYGINACTIGTYAYSDSDFTVATKRADEAHQSEYAFILTNDTSVDMLEFYASPQTATDWEENVLGNRTIRANGDWTTITLTGGRGCLYDFLAVFADGDKLEKYGIDVCELETHTYYEN